MIDWEALLAAENMPAEPTPIPRGFKRYGRFADTSDLAEQELIKPWGEQIANRRPSSAIDAAICRQADTSSLVHKEAELWALYLECGSERKLAQRMGISRHRLWVVWLGPIRSKLGLPVRESNAVSQQRYKSRKSDRLA